MLEGVRSDDALPGQVVQLEAQIQLAQQEIGQLRNALNSARVIGAAIGIIMATAKVTADGALEMLRRSSQDQNVKLRLVAEDVVTTGAVPPLQPRPSPPARSTPITAARRHRQSDQ